MRNYIILNGKNSNEINGLLIQELPPISKPLIRTEVEEIDGRDGDIVTPLGYSAYDKELTIGLYKDFDVNEVAAYFNSEGTVIFSNEPDKYYYYQITAQIDFERLVRYRTATVTMHCQPFKYSATEQPITEDVSGTVSDEGTNLALENTAEAPFNTLDLKGNTSQQTYSGKNLLPLGGSTSEKGLTIARDTTAGSITFGGTTTGTWPWLNNSDVSLPAGTYTFSIDKPLPYNLTLRFYETSSTYPKSASIPAGQTSGSTTTTYPIVYLAMLYGVTSTGTNVPTTTIYPMLESGSTATSFEPYVGGTASPNPDYPQAVKVVTGENMVKIRGKNLFDVANAQMTVARLNSGGSVATGITNRLCTLGYIEVKPNTAYTLGATPEISGKTLQAYIVGYSESGSSTGIGNYPSNAWYGFPITFTTGSNCKYIRVSYRYSDDSDMAATSATNQQLELGSTATAFEPYQEQSYAIKLNAGINYWDNLQSGFLPMSGEYPTTNPSYPNAKYRLVSLKAGQSIRTIFTGADNGSGRLRWINPTTNKVVGVVNKGDYEYYSSTYNFGDGWYDAVITANKDVILGFLDIGYGYTQADFTIEPINFDGIELCGLGDDGAGGYLYQDYIYKNLIDNKWYVHKVVDKIVLDGSEAWYNAGGDAPFGLVIDGALITTSNDNPPLVYCDKFYPVSQNASWGSYSSLISTNNTTVSTNTIRIRYTDMANLSAFQTWLGSNNTTLYYALATPTDTEITNEALIAQLDDIYYHAHAYKGRTHITSSAATGNVPHIIAAEVGEDNESTITNDGNYLSKPKITVYGSGDISLYINDMHVLQITLGDEGYITIDTAQMEAYKDTLDNLKNRLVIGDYSNARLKPGANKIHFTGTVTKYVVENYSRWL